MRTGTEHEQEHVEKKSELSPIKIYTHKKLSKDTTEKIFFAKRNEGK